MLRDGERGGTRYYERLDESLGTLMRAVLRQEVLRLRYRNAEKKVHPHVFEPWTFVLYRDGLYLLGKSSRHPKPRCWTARNTYFSTPPTRPTK